MTPSQLLAPRMSASITGLSRTPGEAQITLYLHAQAAGCHSSALLESKEQKRLHLPAIIKGGSQGGSLELSAVLHTQGTDSTHAACSWSCHALHNTCAGHSILSALQGWCTGSLRPGVDMIACTGPQTEALA